jgi:hypothetical protein
MQESYDNPWFEMTNKPDPIAEVAKRDLARLAREGESLGGTAMDQATKNLSQTSEEDSIERLGKKIGRGLAFAILPLAIWYFGRTSGWW